MPENIVMCFLFFRVALIASVLLNISDCFETQKNKYRGCYEYDSRNALLTEDKESLNKSTTPQLCVENCAKKKFPFAGVLKQECYCGNHVPTDIIKRSDLECNIQCSGDKKFKCGGENKISVYETGVNFQEFIPTRLYIGCYADKSERTLNGPSIHFSNDNTAEKCHKHCYASGYRYFGLADKVECWCGDHHPAQDRVRTEAECDSKCPGNLKEACGGGWRLSLYATGITDIPDTGRFIGCFKNAQNKEAKVEYEIELPRTNTNRRCLNICNERNYIYSGVQSRTKCTCMNLLLSAVFRDDEYNCVKDDCPGDTVERCGARDRIRIYRTRRGDVNLDTEARALGCFQDQEFFRALDGSMITDANLTPALCVSICKNKGFAFAGVEAGNECFCGHMHPSKYTSVDKSECSIPCSGSTNNLCGGPFRISVFSTGLPRSQARVNRWYLGCYKDDDKDNRMFRGQWNQFEDNSPTICHKYCLRIGYMYFGLTWIKECFCGDEDPFSDWLLQESECVKECGGDANQKCGGSWRLSVYRTGIYDIGLNSTEYLGCIKNDGTLVNDRKIDLAWTNLPGRCINICDQLGFAYAAVQRGIECRCGIKRPRIAAEADDSKCEQNCPGFSGQKCGGSSHAKVFRTTVSEEAAMMLNQDITSAAGNCRPSETTRNGQTTCKNDSLLNEEFSNFNTSMWSHTVKMALKPDYEFVTYSTSPDVIYIKSGILHIKPKLQSNDFVQSSIVLENCTGLANTEECKKTVKSSNILPPVSSAQITTKKSFSFRFGRVEIRAKLPTGDWIVPEIWLSPTDNSYGADYLSGQIRIVMTRGNKELDCGGVKLGNQYIQTGVYFGPQNGLKNIIFTKEVTEDWFSKFHDFSIVWTPDNLSFYVDNELLSTVLKTPQDTVRSVAKMPSNNELFWRDGSKLAPFDKEFHFTIGVSVGGINDFPDNCLSNKVKKPWSNTSPKAMLNFWEKRNQWKSTWNDNSIFQVDHIKVNAL